MIELLVVIAIIGILSSVVLASLNSARAKGADAAIKANLANMRAEAEIYYDGAGNSSYGPSTNSCTVGMFQSDATQGGDPTIAKAIAAAQTSSGGQPACFSNGSSWAISLPLKTNNQQYWCVDSSGTSATQATPVNGSICQ